MRLQDLPVSCDDGRDPTLQRSAIVGTSRNTPTYTPRSGRLRIATHLGGKQAFRQDHGSGTVLVYLGISGLRRLTS